jgi:hypothetical protein
MFGKHGLLIMTVFFIKVLIISGSRLPNGGEPWKTE